MDDGGEDAIPAPQTSKAPIRNHAVGTTVCTYLPRYFPRRDDEPRIYRRRRERRMAILTLTMTSVVSYLPTYVSIENIPLTTIVLEIGRLSTSLDGVYIYQVSLIVLNHLRVPSPSAASASDLGGNAK
jgi:hypothetical protein